MIHSLNLLELDKDSPAETFGILFLLKLCFSHDCSLLPSVSKDVLNAGKCKMRGLRREWQQETEGTSPLVVHKTISGCLLGWDPHPLPPSAPSKRHTGPFLLLGDMEGSPAVSSRELCWCLSRLHLQDHPQSQSACRQEPQSSPSSPQLSLGVSCGLATCPLSHHGSRFPGQTPVSPHTLSHAFEQTDPWEREWDHKGHF